MRTKVTLVLLFLNVALFFFIFRFERGWRTEMASKEARRRVLGSGEAANIQSLKINGPGVTQPVSLVKRSDGWYLTEPFVWPANLDAVNRIIYDLGFLEYQASWGVAELVKNKGSLADYGLDKPSIIVSLSSTDPLATAAPGSAAVAVTLRLGDKTPVGNLLYLLTPDGQRVDVVSRSLADSLSQTVDQLRSPTVFTIPFFEARFFNLTFLPANFKIRLRHDQNRWFFDAPISDARASKTETELAISALDGLQVKTFVPGTTDPSRIANPHLRISLEGDKRTETLVLFDPVNVPPPADNSAPATGVEYYARMEGKVDLSPTLFTVVIPNALKSRLDNAQTDLRDKRLFDFDPRTVTAVTLSSPNRPELVLARDVEATPLPTDATATAKGPVKTDDSWQIVQRTATQGPQTQPADRSIVQRLLELLDVLPAKNFLNDVPTAQDLENWGFNQSERVVTLALSGAPNAPPVTIKLELGVGLQHGPSAFARIGGAGSVYEVDSSILAELSVDPLFYRARLLRDLPAGAQITHVKLTDNVTKAVIFDQAISSDPKDAALQPLRKDLQTLRAKKFVLGTFSPTVKIEGEDRPWKYLLEATATPAGGTGGAQASLTSIFLSERVGGTTQYAGSPEFSAIWEIEQSLIDDLGKLTYGARDPGPPSEVLTPPVPKDSKP